jgi:RNA polymerase sigma-70 factor (ECF subfamily)
MNTPEAVGPASSAQAFTTTAAGAANADPERWVDEHGDCLYRYALTRVRKEEVAEDLVQDTLLAAVRTHEKFGGRSTERSWLVGILKNKICDHFRKLGRETTFTDLEFFSDEHSDKFDGADYWIHERGPSEWKPEGEEAMKRAEFWQALHGALGRLPERIAQVFMMREMDGVPSKEVCETLNISEANLWVMLHRARMALRLDLETNFFHGKGATTL